MTRTARRLAARSVGLLPALDLGELARKLVLACDIGGDGPSILIFAQGADCGLSRTCDTLAREGQSSPAASSQKWARSQSMEETVADK
jgi:hypothetical protein